MLFCRGGLANTLPPRAPPTSFLGPSVRITLFARQLAPYTISFLRALAARGHRLELVYEPASGQAPFQAFDLSCCELAIADGDRSYRRAWLRRGPGQLPDAAYIAGWTEPLERQAGRLLRRHGRPVICGIDNPWTGSWRQRLGCWLAPFRLWPMARAAWVAGEPQAEFARRLGYRWVETGLYCADVEAYRCELPLTQRPPAFLFTGRLIADKGVDLLVEAYRAYRSQVSQPMDLLVAGTGPLAALTQGVEGLRPLGFVQPEQLPAWMSRCQALVLPSRDEHWGVVIHEAAAAGLPVLASEGCMAATAFVRDGLSGYLYPPTVSALTDRLLRFHRLDAREKEEMSRQSKDLALTWSPRQQAEAFEKLLQRMTRF